jgi:hypothetical protein
MTKAIKVVEVSEVIRVIAKEESKQKGSTNVKASKVYKQLGLTMDALNNELSRSEPSDMGLEYFFNKITQLEKFL